VTNQVMGLKFLSQSTQSAGPVRFFIFSSISIFLLASLVAGRKTQCTAGADQQGMYSTMPFHKNIKSAPAGPSKSGNRKTTVMTSQATGRLLTKPIRQQVDHRCDQSDNRQTTVVTSQGTGRHFCDQPGNR
jgi:hypothetical protein